MRIFLLIYSMTLSLFLISLKKEITYNGIESKLFGKYINESKKYKVI